LLGRDSYRWDSQPTVAGTAGQVIGYLIEQGSGNGWYRAVMAEVYLPAGWPDAVAPPGAQDWERSAVNWLVDLAPDLRGHTAIRRILSSWPRLSATSWPGASRARAMATASPAPNSARRSRRTRSTPRWPRTATRGAGSPLR